MAKNDIRAQGRMRVIFHSQEGPGGNDDVFVSVNGKAYLIKREHEVSLPREVLHAVENARQTVFEPGPEGKVLPRQVSRFAYSVLGEEHAG